MALMSRLEPPLLKNHMAIYPLGAAWTMADRRKAKPSLAQHDQAISWTGWYSAVARGWRGRYTRALEVCVAFMHYCMHRATQSYRESEYAEHRIALRLCKQTLLDGPARFLSEQARRCIIRLVIQVTVNGAVTCTAVIAPWPPITGHGAPSRADVGAGDPSISCGYSGGRSGHRRLSGSQPC